jgi:hypothetical protein
MTLQKARQQRDASCKDLRQALGEVKQNRSKRIRRTTLSVNFKQVRSECAFSHATFCRG